jgi:predicted nucleic acid-binding protein
VLSQLAYVDASAFVKLVVDEPESDALGDALARLTMTSSAILEVEATLVVRRRQPRSFNAVRRLLGSVRLVDVEGGIRRAAGDLEDPGLRSLDAIHLATALSLGERCGAFFAYDDRLAAAARAHGLTVTVPRP